MRIVNLEEFRSLPEMTVFRKYEPCVCGDLQFKGETLEHDFIAMSVEMPQNNGSDQLFDRLDEMKETGCSYPVEVDGWGRDGLFEKDQLFMVYDKADLEAIRKLLDQAIEVASIASAEGG